MVILSNLFKAAELVCLTVRPSLILQEYLIGSLHDVFNLSQTEFNFLLINIATSIRGQKNMAQLRAYILAEFK